MGVEDALVHPTSVTTKVRPVSEKTFRALSGGVALIVLVAVLTPALLAGQRLLVAQGVTLIVTAVAALGVAVVGVVRTLGRDRLWRVLVGSNLVIALFGALDWIRSLPVDHRAGVGAVDLLYILPALLILVGMLLAPTEPDGRRVGRGPPRDQGRRPRYSDALVVLDGLVIVASMLLIVWIAVLDRIVASGVRGWPFITGLMFPLAGMLGVVVAMLVGTFRRPRNGRSLALLAVGLAAQVPAESETVILTLERAPRIDATAPYWACLAIGPPLIALALVVPDRDRPVGRSAAGELAPAWMGRLPGPLAHFYLPYLPLGVAVALILGLAASGAALGGDVLYLAFALAMLVAVRQLITVAQNVRLLAAVQTAHEQLRHQAFHDPLTGLPNRAHFTRDLERAVTDHRTDNHPVALLFCDLDDFKTINDTLGHAAGDDLLKAVAHRLTTAVRDDDLVARLGGDEFAILLTCPDPDDVDADHRDPDLTDDSVIVAHRIGQRILAAMSPPFTIRGRRRTMRFSIGLAVADLDEPVDVAEQLLRRADSAMYAAKRAAKGSLVAYRHQATCQGGTQDETAGSSLSPCADAITAGPFTVCYQPIRRLEGGRTAAVEALFCWLGPRGRPVAARELLDEADRDGRIEDLDRYLLDRACHDLPAVRAQLRAPVRLHLNVAPSSIDSGGFVDRVEEALRRHQLSADTLVLEIASTARVPDLAAAAAPLRRLAEAGVGIALDGVGASESSLGALFQLPISLVKLDQALSVDPPAGPRPTDTPILAARKAVLDFARTTGLTVAADGITTQAQLDTLRAAGCELGQGSLLGAPQPLPELAPA